ncbi:TPA: recombinase family protein, partial [Klebsiella quasipneumoniae subsp. quasipneumoniae]|nr:recombinase family protein [Klebsiella quasipneumoniae subsp. quasipneumoniae]
MAHIGYIRVSSIQQNTERQLADVTLDKVFEEKASGKNIERKQFRAMMDYVREGDTLHIHSIDRLCRKTADLLATVEELTKRGVIVQFHKEGFKTGKESAFGNFMLTVLAGVAQ